MVRPVEGTVLRHKVIGDVHLPPPQPRALLRAPWTCELEAPLFLPPRGDLVAAYLHVVTATGQHHPFSSWNHPRRWLEGFVCPGVGLYLCGTPPPLKEWGFRLLGTLSQGCPRMKRAQPSLDAHLGQRAEDSPLLHLLQSLPTPPPPHRQRKLLTVMEDSFGCPGHEAQHRVGRMAQGGDVTWDE